MVREKEPESIDGGVHYETMAAVYAMSDEQRNAYHRRLREVDWYALDRAEQHKYWRYMQEISKAERELDLVMKAAKLFGHPVSVVKSLMLQAEKGQTGEG